MSIDTFGLTERLVISNDVIQYRQVGRLLWGMISTTCYISVGTDCTEYDYFLSDEFSSNQWLKVSLGIFVTLR